MLVTEKKSSNQKRQRREEEERRAYLSLVAVNENRMIRPIQDDRERSRNVALRNSYERVFVWLNADLEVLKPVLYYKSCMGGWVWFWDKGAS